MPNGMKIKIKRKTGNSAVPTIGANENVAGEPVLGTTTIGGGSTQFDTLYVGGLSGNEWKKVSMAEFTPAYVEQGQTAVNFSVGMYSFWFGSQTDYNAINPKDQNTFYFITE